MTSDGPPPTAPPSRTGALQPLRDGADWLLALVRGSPVRSGAVLGALLLIAVAGAPLAAQVWDAFWSLPYAGRIVLCGLGLAVIVTTSVHRSRLQLRQRAEQARLGSLIAIAWAVVVAVVVLLVAGAWWVMGAPQPDFPSTLQPRALDALATRAFAIVAGLGAAALLVIHYRRQRTTEADAVRAEAANVRAELAAEREVAKLFTETFDSASSKLGNEHAAVRLAGVHALARLADEAPEGREDLVQMVIDVLCAYLRMPYTPAPETLPKNASKARREEHREQELEFASFREVRHTIIRIINDHLRKDTCWRGKNYDFTGTVFDGGNLSRSHFTGGVVSFSETEFSGGNLSFYGARFTGGLVSFYKARFTAGVVSFYDTRFSGGSVYFGEARFSGGTVYFDDAEFTGGTVHFGRARFTGGLVSFEAASGLCPDNLLEAVQSGELGVVVLPDEWQVDSIVDEEEAITESLSDTPDH